MTPEFIRTITSALPDVTVYALRLDRGMSPAEVLEATPGKFWEREFGLNDHQYIVPGGGLWRADEQQLDLDTEHTCLFMMKTRSRFSSPR